MKGFLWTLLLTFPLLAGAAGSGTESPNKYDWSELQGERMKALQLPGHPEAGQRLFAQNCVECHLANAGGRSDGSTPQLAGQLAVVIIKELADIHEGIRDPKLMHRHADSLTTAQQLADVAAYLEKLPVPKNLSRGPENPSAVERGRSIYVRGCQKCHGSHGEGQESSLKPRLAHQHYLYTLRQLRNLCAGRRQNAHQEMVRICRQQSDAELEALANYISRL